MTTPLALVLAFAPAMHCTTPSDGPIELGNVRFLRSVDDGLARAASEKKPAFVLFQEVPGCATCKGFGRGPLSDALFVEAIETLFVPVCVHNNGGGADAAALKRFDEPSWNNPVVRFVDAQGKDLVARKDGVWDSAGLARRMTSALAASQRPIPAWWELAELDARRDSLPRAVFAMHCFWEGQAQFGALAGVADARPAFLEGMEVVEVRYDPDRSTLEALIAAAERAHLAQRVWVDDEARLSSARKSLGDRARALREEPRAAPASDDLRALKRTPLMALSLPRAQAVRANAELARGALAPDTLSPRQREASSRSSAGEQR